MCSFLHIRDACQGPSPRSWSDEGKEWGQQRRNVVFRTSWSKMGLQSPIVCYTEPLFMPDTVWGPDLFGHGLSETLVVFSKMISISRGKSQHQSFKQRGILGQPDCAKINATKQP